MSAIEQTPPLMTKGINPLHRIAGFLALGIALLFGFLIFRWMTFSTFDWKPYTLELVFSDFPPLVPYLIYFGFGLAGLATALGLRQQFKWSLPTGVILGIAGLGGSIFYYSFSRDFYISSILIGLSGMLLIALGNQTAWTINFPAAYWLIVFFVAPMFIVLVASLGERTIQGTIAYPEFSFSNLGAYFDDYARFFGKINNQYLYLEILWRSVKLAALNTLICLLLGYPFAYWIARRPQKYRNILIFLVMIPFWTNFLVRTYAWMLILRDSGLINNFWTVTLHEQAVLLAANSTFFAWLAEATSSKLPLLFNQSAVFMGMFYGFFPFVVLPLYSNLEKLDWSLLEAAADLGASSWKSTIRVLLPLTMPGIVAAAIIVFIPSLGAYVTPDLLGGGKVVLLGNLLQQQFMTARDWPFGSAIGFIMMAMMLLAIMIYFRTGGNKEQLA